MSEKIYDIPADVAQRAWIDENKYRAMYERSVEDPDGFWAEQAKEFVTWSKPWKKVPTGASMPGISISNGSRAASSTSPGTASTGTSPGAAIKRR